MDNQRLITWGFFAIMAYLTWQTWQQDYVVPPAAVDAPAAETSDSSLPSLAPPDDSDLPVVTNDDAGLPSLDAPAPAAVPEARASNVPAITVRTDVLDVTIDPRGGVLTGARILDYPVEKDDPDRVIELLSDDPNNISVIRSRLRSSNGQVAPDNNALFASTRTEFTLSDSEDVIEVPLVWTDESGVRVEKTFTFKRGRYDVGLTQTLINSSGTAWSGDSITQAVRRSKEADRSMFDVDSYSFDGPQVFDQKGAEKLDRGDLEDGAFSIATEDGWYASLQHHFLTAIVPASNTKNRIHIELKNNRTTASLITAQQSIASGASGTFETTLFIGPKLQSQLKDVHPELPLSVDYGWLTLLSNPMFMLLSFIYGFVGNWGWAIIGVTIVIKIIFYPLSQSSGRSMAKMRELQPRMKALQDRYKDDRQALGQATMELYKREKVNPAAGCLPILIQMPFFLAFYWVLVESVEMRQAPFMLWITDLSVRDPYFILPLIMGAAMIFQQRLNPAPTDPVQAKVMQIMPVMFTVFFAFFPSGLVLYWVTNTLLSIAQQWRINQVVHREAQEQKNRKNKKNKKKKDDKAAD